MNSHNGHRLRPSPSPRRQPRIALYSHDTMGVGHLRRNLLIAQCLASTPTNANVLLIAGAREAGLFATASGVDCVTLPALSKDECGNYGARRFRLSLRETVAVRSQIIAAATTAFDPDLLIVDKVPRGAGNELDETLQRLVGNGRTRCVLGLREILDCPANVAKEWRETGADNAISSYYDELWVYGDQSVFDPVAEYQFSPEVAERVRFTGYLNQSVRLTSDAQSCDEDFSETGRPFALCVVGGGQDGFGLAGAFLDCSLPDGWDGVVIGGPFMPGSMKLQLRETARQRPSMRFVESVREADWFIAHAARVVGMGGYNTICSILSFQKPALIVPRVTPRSEQYIRAQYLSRLNVLDMLHPDQATPAAISRWLNSASVSDPTKSRPIDMCGLDRISQRVECLLAAPICHTTFRAMGLSPLVVLPESCAVVDG